VRMLYKQMKREPKREGEDTSDLPEKQ